MEKAFSTLDVYIASWIYLSTNVYPNLENQNGRVTFHFHLTEEIIRSIDEFNSGNKINALQYSQTIKQFKSQIFQIKSQNK